MIAYCGFRGQDEGPSSTHEAGWGVATGRSRLSPTLGWSLGRCSHADRSLRSEGHVLNSAAPRSPTGSFRKLCRSLRRRSSAHQRACCAHFHWPGATRPTAHWKRALYTALLTPPSALRYGCCQGSGGTETGFCALGTPPGSLPARSSSQLRPAARGQGGVGKCRARLRGRVPLLACPSLSGVDQQSAQGRPLQGFSLPLPLVISYWVLRPRQRLSSCRCCRVAESMTEPRSTRPPRKSSKFVT